MEYAVENARMNEFIESKGLTVEYNAFVANYEKQQRELAEPEFTVQYEKNYSRRSRDDYMNITPWMRQASQEDMLRLARLAMDDHDDRSVDDASFLKGVIEHCADEEEQDWLFRASDVTVWLHDFADEIRPLLADIRPTDHEIIAAALVKSKGPMCAADAGDEPEAVGALI